MKASRPAHELHVVPGPGAGPAFPGFSLDSHFAVDAHGEVASVQEMATVGGRLAPKECTAHHEADLDVPLPVLAQRMPGVDLWCHFGFLGFWARECALARKQRNYELFAVNINYSAALPRNGTLFNVSYDAGWFLSRNNIFIYDDIYCHANGWLRGQGLPPVRNNFTAWKEVARGYCTSMEGRYPLQELVMSDMMRRTKVELEAITAHYDGHGPEVMARDIQRHASVKCAMGDAGCDMAICQNWCLLPDHSIGRNEAECGEYWT